MRTSLVTGGAGFIGSHVAEELVRRGHEVVVLDDLSGGFQANVPSGAEFIQGSILDHRLLNRLFDERRFDYVFHLAAYAAEGLSHFIKRFNHANNLIGTVNLIDAAVNYDVKQFVFTSSIAVYGTAQSPVSEDLTPLPEDPYGIAKLACELELQATQRMFGLNYTIFRPHNVYGERQNIGDRYRNVVGIFMNQVLKGEPMTIFGDGEQIRAFTHVSDVAPVIVECLDTPAALNETFNVGADAACTVNELAGFVARAMGVECRIKRVAPRSEVKVAFANHQKARDIFCARPSTPLAAGLQRMAKWVHRHGARESAEFAGIEITRGLPEAWQSSTSEAHRPRRKPRTQLSK